MDPLTGRRVVVTGAAGFIGANLIRELLKWRAEVHALIRLNTSLWRLQEILPEITIHRTDITDLQELHQIANAVSPEFIFHLAAVRPEGTLPSRVQSLLTNILGTFAILQAAADCQYRRFVYIGSAPEYPMTKSPLKETYPPEPVSFFGATKAAATLLCQQFARERGQPIVVLRLFNAYGPWDRPQRLIPQAILAAMDGSELPLTSPGYRRDWLYVEDLVEACLRALQVEEVSGEVINIASGKEYSSEEVVKRVEEVSRKQIRIRVGEHAVRPWDRVHWVGDIRKARRLLGWKPRYNLRQGLEMTIAWFQTHREVHP